MLKQKRMYEQQLQQLQQQTFNMEQAAMTTENLRNTVRCERSAKSRKVGTKSHRITALFPSTDGNGRCDAAGQQGDEEAIQGN